MITRTRILQVTAALRKRPGICGYFPPPSRNQDVHRAKLCPKELLEALDCDEACLAHSYLTVSRRPDSRHARQDIAEQISYSFDEVTLVV